MYEYIIIIRIKVLLFTILPRSIVYTVTNLEHRVDVSRKKMKMGVTYASKTVLHISLHLN